MKNSETVGKYIIVKDLQFSDFMKDKEGNIKLYEEYGDAQLDCWIEEFPDALILKVEYNYIEKE